MKRTIAFFVDKELGLSLALAAIKRKCSRMDKFLILCKKRDREYFSDTKAKIIKSESEAFKHNPNIIFSINYWKKIKKKYVQQFRVINLHHSYNLTYRGRHTCSWAIINARKCNNWIHGTTLHIIDENIDCGQIICSYSCPIFEDDTAYSLFLRVDKLARKMFNENYPKILNGNYRVRKLPPSKFYYSKNRLSHLVDLNQPKIDIYDRVRALTFPCKPVPYTIINGSKIKLVWEGKVEPEE